MNCLNGFWTISARDNHYEYCSSNGYVKAKMPSEKEKCLKFHDGQYQFKAPFMPYGDFESILKLVDEKIKREKRVREREERLREKVRHRIEKRKTHMYHQDGVYREPLLMEMFVIH